MADDADMMTEEQFDDCYVRYGADLGRWPADRRAAAARFAGTATGIKYQKATVQMDALFSAAAASEQQAETDAFLARLAGIPDTYDQVVDTTAPTAADMKIRGISVRSFAAFFEQFFEPSRLFSLRGLVSQGAFAVVLLVSGIVVGLDAGQIDEFEEYDVSAALFGEEDQGFSLDG